jgi:L-malate glycosyltransferase
LQFVAFPALLAGAKVVYTEHAKHSILKYPRLRRQARILSVLCSKVVCVSHDLKQFMVKDVGVKPSRIEVIHNGVDLERFTALEPDQKTNSKSELVIGTVARLTEAKDHGNLLRAFALVREKISQARLVLVGDGELRREIETMIRDLDLERSVDLLGKRSDIPKQLAHMDIFVLPSKREGFPVSIIEAMACAKPVVATDVGGVREIINDGEDGVIVPPEDHSSLATALLRLAQDFGLRERLGSKARLKAIEQFSEQAMMEKYQGLFNKTGGRVA